MKRLVFNVTLKVPNKLLPISKEHMQFLQAVCESRVALELNEQLRAMKPAPAVTRVIHKRLTP